MADITILPLTLARHCARDYDFVLTVEDIEETNGLRIGGQGAYVPVWADPGSSSSAQTSPHQLVLAFEDLDEESPQAATVEHVEKAIAFARQAVGKKLLVHCVKGQARSPSIALAIIADRLGPGSEAEAVHELLRIRPDGPTSLLGPNLHVLRVADAVLGRNGALIDAWMTYENAHMDDRRAQYRFWRIEAPRSLAP